MNRGRTVIAGGTHAGERRSFCIGLKHTKVNSFRNSPDTKLSLSLLSLPAVRSPQRTHRCVGSQLGREQFSELGFSLLQECVLALLALLGEIEEPRRVTSELHHARLSILVGVEGRLQARYRRRAVLDYSSAPLHGLLHMLFSHNSSRIESHR